MLISLAGLGICRWNIMRRWLPNGRDDVSVVADHDHRFLGLTFGLLIVVVSLVAVIPGIWPAGLLAVTATSIASSRNSPSVELLFWPVLILVGFFGYWHNQTGWLTAVLVAAGIVAGNGLFRKRREQRLTLHDGSPNGSLAASNAITDFTNLDASTVLRIDDTDTAVPEAHRRAYRDAETDLLTGLANRSRFLREIEERLDGEAPIALFLVDLNRFKQINNTLGHQIGDEVLVHSAERLAAAVGPDGVVARLGGDEFAAIVTIQYETTAVVIARKMAEALSQPIEADGIAVSNSAAIGFTYQQSGNNGINDQRANVKTLLRQADIAMYESKQDQAGPTIYKPETGELTHNDHRLAAEIPQAIRDSQFVLHYEPLIELSSGDIVGFEALSRWQHPSLGILSPNEFIPFVTISKDNKAFTEQAIDDAVAFAARCNQKGHTISVSVNIAARSLFDDSLPTRVEYILKRHQLKPSQLVLEVTETDLMHATDRASHVPARLANLGVRLAIDDFGTGYSSFSRLVDLPVSIIKIDRHFVNRATSITKYENIVRSIIDLGHRLDLTVIAEGAEDISHIELLKDASCDFAQGFYYGRPSPESDALKLISTTNLTNAHSPVYTAG